MKSKKGSGASFIEEQYFGEITNSESSDESNESGTKSDSSFIEDQFFGTGTDSNFSLIPEESENSKNAQFSMKKSAADTNTATEKSVANENVSFIDEEFFGLKAESSKQIDSDVKSFDPGDHFNSDFFKNVLKHRQERSTAAEEEHTETEAPEQPPPSALTPKLDPLEFARLQQRKDDELMMPLQEEEGALAADQVPALEFVLDFRRRTGINQSLSPGDSFYQRYFRAEKPFPERTKVAQDSYEALEMEAREEERRRSGEAEKFVPFDASPPWSAMTICEITTFLKKLVIYEDEDILAINKPYGLACQGEGRDLFSLLPRFADHLKLRQPLIPVHRLDAGTTGALLLARHEDAARRIKQQFARREVLKRYVAVVTGVPRTREGVVSTPIAQLYDPVNAITKSVLVPSDEMTVRRGRRELQLQDKKAAETAYQVVVSKHKASLLVCEPSTGVRHQLRVHLADGLGCPVLGDHKYSTFWGKKPQRLPRAMEQQLNMDRPKARHFMLHLHCLGLSLREQEPLGIYARPHPFFLKTLNKLGMILPNFLRRMRPLL